MASGDAIGVGVWIGDHNVIGDENVIRECATIQVWQWRARHDAHRQP